VGKKVIQFNESATDDRAETACNGLEYSGNRSKGRTREGATSEMMTNGTGPSPTAKDLESQMSRVGKTRQEILASRRTKSKHLR